MTPHLMTQEEAEAKTDAVLLTAVNAYIRTHDIDRNCI